MTGAFFNKNGIVRAGLFSRMFSRALTLNECFLYIGKEPLIGLAFISGFVMCKAA
jgi:hypothetical protein